MNNAVDSDLARTVAPDGRTYAEIAEKCRMTVYQVEEYYQKMKRLVGDTGVPIAPPDAAIFKGRTAIVATTKKLS